MQQANVLSFLRKPIAITSSMSISILVFMTSFAAEAAPGAVSTSADVLPDEIAVDWKDDSSPTEIRTILGPLAPLLEWSSSQSENSYKLSKIKLPKGSNVNETLEKLRKDSHVEFAEPMSLYWASMTPNDPLYEKQWHLTRVGAETAWNFGCGRGVSVAVIDTGVACFDKDGFSKTSDLLGTRCQDGKNFVDPSLPPFDDHGHGTHVAGTIAQTTNNQKGTAGLAYCSSLMPIKVLNRDGWGTLVGVAEGIRYAADHGAQVINLSLGGRMRSQILEAAVNHAIKKNVVIVAAAGNSGSEVGYPAAYDGVIAVSASDKDDRLARFSSRGKEIFIAAPGVDVTQQTICNEGKNKCEVYGTFNGTSMASPHVAGAAALLIGEGISQREKVHEHLQKSARQVGPSNEFGAGVLDVGSSLRAFHLSKILWRVAFGILFLGLITHWIRRQNGKLNIGLATIFGFTLTGLGILFFAPWTGLTSAFSNHRWVADWLSHPFGEWDLLAGPTLRKWLLLASILPSVGIAALAFGFPTGRRFITGFALGNAALLAQYTMQNYVAGAYGSFFTIVYFVINLLLCLWIARLSADQKDIP